MEYLAEVYTSDEEEDIELETPDTKIKELGKYWASLSDEQAMQLSMNVARGFFAEESNSNSV